MYKIWIWISQFCKIFHILSILVLLNKILQVKPMRVYMIMISMVFLQTILKHLLGMEELISAINKKADFPWNHQTKSNRSSLFTCPGTFWRFWHKLYWVHTPLKDSENKKIHLSFSYCHSMSALLSVNNYLL